MPRCNSAVLLLAFSAYVPGLEAVPPPEPDLIVVGAGIAGLSAALEGARAGLKITIIDRNSVYGGHAVLSSGAVCIVGTPVQEKMGLKDTPEIAYKDFMSWGEDANEAFVRYYVKNSKAEIYDWLASMGVEFASTMAQPGNSVPRFHTSRSMGLGLVRPLYKEILRRGGVEFIWNTDVTSLLRSGKRVTGVTTKNLRTGEARNFMAHHVLLATGGYQNNMKLVRDNWPRNIPVPQRVVLGSGHHSTGSGLELARDAGAAIVNLDHQWNYARGLPDPRDPTGERGLSVANYSAIWVNAQGKRFVNEFADPKITVPAVASQKSGRFFMVFDADGARGFNVISAGFSAEQVQKVVFGAPNLIARGDTVEETARKAGLPPAELSATVQRYNELAKTNDDKDFGRFPMRSGRFAVPPKGLLKGPFYVAPMYLLSRKSLGGISVDADCRALNRKREVIPGLYAAGETTGFGGLNGRAGLEGTFLGPSILMGRIAARGIAAKSKPPVLSPERNVDAEPRPSASGNKAEVKDSACVTCHNIPKLLVESRPGYWHFEQSHSLVLDRKLPCVTCHSALAPFQASTHKIDRLQHADVCRNCHEGRSADYRRLGVEP